MSEIWNHPRSEPTDLRSRLLEVEPPDVARLNQLKQEIASMYIQSLQHSDRVAWRTGLIFACIGAIAGAFVTVKINVPPEMGSKSLLRIVWAFFTLSCLGSVFYTARVLRKGEIDQRRRVVRSRARLFVTVTIAVLLIAQAVSHPTIPMLAWALFGVLWVIIAAMRNISNRITQSELATREALLRLELRLSQPS